MSIRPYNELTISGKKFAGPGLADYIHKQRSGIANPDWRSSLYNFISEWLSDSEFVQLKTSGSTGIPQILHFEKEKLIKSALLTGRYFNLRKNHKALLCLPVDFIAGKMMVVRAFVLGLNLIPVSPSSNPLAGIFESFDFAALTPLQVKSILDDTDGFEKLNRIKILIIGGGEISSPVMSLIPNLKNKTYHTYGMTETLTHVAIKKLNGTDVSDSFVALDDIRFKTDDRNCLMIDAKHLGNETIITNDIVEVIDENRFKYIGRADNRINSGGLKFSAEQIEKKLEPFIDVRFIVAGIPDDKLGQKIILILETEKPEQYNLEDIIKTAGLSKYEKPKIIFTLASFFKTGTGKIIRPKTIERLLSSI